MPITARVNTCARLRMCVLLHEPLLSLYELFPWLTAALYEAYLNQTCPALLSLRTVGRNPFVWCKMFSLGISAAVNLSLLVVSMHEADAHVFVCDRTRGTRARGGLSSVAPIRTIATETCIPRSLHSWRQVRRKRTHSVTQVSAHRNPAPL